MRYAILCNDKGQPLCGSDGRIRIDGRCGHDRRMSDVREYRKRFNKYFHWKYTYWTHVYFANRIDSDPTTLHKID